MVLSGFFKWIKHELKVLTGNESKDRQYSNKKEYADVGKAKSAFGRSKRKLFDVNGWSKMEGINSKFKVYNQHGEPDNKQLQKGFFIKIELPGPKIENWVQVTDMRNEPDLAEFIVHPSEKPREKTDPNAEVKHFFVKEASSTFRVLRKENIIEAFEIGRNEAINNQGDESGDRSVLNTLIAEGGWAGFQKIQWEKLTRYLVHLQEADKEK